MTATLAASNPVLPLPRDGVIVPMITPLLPDGTVDGESTAHLAVHLADAGVKGLLVLGSSGESAALGVAERRKAVETVVKAASNRVHVMVGVPALGTNDAMADAEDYARLGVGSLLVSAPFGLELSPHELYGHFSSIGAAGAVPLVAYEVPSRVKISLGTDLLTELAKDSVIAGVKDSSGNLGAARMRSQALAAWPDVVQYTGSEESIDAFLLGGGHGAVPGLANVFPRFHVALADHAARGDWEAAARVQTQILPLLDLYFEPIPQGGFMAQFFGIVKEALVQQGVIAHNTTSTPFVQPDAGIAEHVSGILDRAASVTIA